jgi:hypothetical protein
MSIRPLLRQFSFFRFRQCRARRLPGPGDQGRQWRRRGMDGRRSLCFQKMELNGLHTLAIAMLLAIARRSGVVGRIRLTVRFGHFITAGMVMGFPGHGCVHSRIAGAGTGAMAKDREAGGEGHQQE